MIHFNSYEEIKEVHDKKTHDIFYENGKTKYIVTNIGSTILCFDEKKNLGMGAITNFNVSNFYGIEKPKPVIVEENKEEINQE